MIIHAFDTNIKSNPNFVIFISSDETDGDVLTGIGSWLISHHCAVSTENKLQFDYNSC